MMGTETKKFKVGDRVRRINSHVIYGLKFGDVCTVSRVVGRFIGLEEFEVFDSTPFDAHNFELVEQPAKWVPKVGDRVVGDKTAGGVDMVEHWNSHFRSRSGDLDSDAFIVVSVSQSLIGVSNKVGGRCFYVGPKYIKPAPAAPALTIEAGKFYKTRDGSKVGPMVWDRFCDGWIVKLGDGSAWERDGKARKFALINSDLIAEWVDEPVTAQAAPKFKVGDRVRIVVGDGEYKKYIGTEFTIDSDEGDYDGQQSWAGRDHSSPYRWKESQLSIATSTPTAIVALIENGVPKPSERPFVHATEAAAATESKRLAAKHKGQKFGVYVLTTTSQEDAPTYEHEWQRLAAKGEKINAIKELRAATGLHLATAKNAVEDWIIRAA